MLIQQQHCMLSGAVTAHRAFDGRVAEQASAARPRDDRHAHRTDRARQDGGGVPQGARRAPRVDRAVGEHHRPDAEARPRNGPTGSGKPAAYSQH